MRQQFYVGSEQLVMWLFIGYNPDPLKKPEIKKAEVQL